MREAPCRAVYYTPSVTKGRPGRWLLWLAVAVSLGGPSAFAQTGAPLTIHPAMTKGPADAPVTIVEFSDYQ